MARSRQIAYGKIQGACSAGDLMTKAVEAETMERHLAALGYQTYTRADRNPRRTAPRMPRSSPKAGMDGRTRAAAVTRVHTCSFDIVVKETVDFPEPHSSTRMHPPKAEGERMT